MFVDADVTFHLICFWVNTYVPHFPKTLKCEVIYMTTTTLRAANIIEGPLLTGRIQEQDQTSQS